MTLEPEELPGGNWLMTAERSWRSGYIVPVWNSEVARRTRAAGGFATWREFRQSTSAHGLWAQISPYGLASDAGVAVPRLLSMSYKNPNFEGKETEAKSVNISIRGVEHTYAEERNSIGSSKGPSNTKYVVASVLHVVFLLACYEYGSGWPWSEVISIAERQAAKIRSQLSDGSGLTTD